MDGLVAWYRMDEAPAAGNVIDSASGHDGSCTACPVLVAGRIGEGAYQFSGTGDEILIADAEELHSVSGTVSVWVYLLDDEPHAIVSKPFQTDMANSWLLLAQGSSLLLFETMTVALWTSPAELVPQQWIHLAGVWSPTGNITYVNGERVGSDGEGTVFDGNPVVLGADHDHGDQIEPLFGQLDDVRIYDRALSASEIDELAGM